MGRQRNFDDPPGRYLIRYLAQGYAKGQIVEEWSEPTIGRLDEKGDMWVEQWGDETMPLHWTYEILQACEQSGDGGH